MPSGTFSSTQQGQLSLYMVCPIRKIRPQLLRGVWRVVFAELKTFLLLPKQLGNFQIGKLNITLPIDNSNQLLFLMVSPLETNYSRPQWGRIHQDFRPVKSTLPKRNQWNSTTKFQAFHFVSPLELLGEVKWNDSIIQQYTETGSQLLYLQSRGRKESASTSDEVHLAHPKQPGYHH